MEKLNEQPNPIEREKIIQDSKIILIESLSKYVKYMSLDQKYTLIRRDGGDPSSEFMDEFNKAKKECIEAQNTESQYKEKYPDEHFLAEIDNDKDLAAEKILRGDVYNGGGMTLFQEKKGENSLTPENLHFISLVEERFGKGSVEKEGYGDGSYTNYVIHYGKLKSVIDEVERLKKERNK